MHRIRGLLFDKDGTLFDFSASWLNVIERTLDVLGRDADERNRMALAVGYDRAKQSFVPGSLIVAGAIDEFAAVWAEFRTDLGKSEIETTTNRIVDEAVADGALTPAVPDLRGFLLGLRSMGYMLGVATHDSEAAAIDQIGRYGSLDCFDFIAGYDSGFGLKPGAGMMQAFCAATGLTPLECAMIGDSVHDLGVVEASGAALAIGVLTGPATDSDLAPFADYVIPSIVELPALLRRV